MMRERPQVLEREGKATLEWLRVAAKQGFGDIELAGVRETLNNRYDDLKSGRVSPIASEEAFARLKAKTEA